MIERELRRLRGQILLIAGLLGGCIVLAAGMATQRRFIEKYLKEKYAPLPASLLPLAEAAAQGRLDGEEFAKLGAGERLALYDYWMARPEPAPRAMPRVLAAADAPRYLARAERTLVCGNPEQRPRALLFLELSGSPDALPLLRRAEDWARSRRMRLWADDIAATIRRLENVSSSGT